MSERRVIGFAALVCVACCSAPIVGILGGIAAVGLLSTVFIGVDGLAVAMLGIAAVVLLRRKRARRAIPGDESPVTLTTRR